MNTPILFLIFNRIDTTSRVFEKIKEAKPPRLYIASDGPRLHKDGESDIVKKTRKMVLDGIDWGCEVKTLFRDENLGCGKAVSSAITWFFENEPEGIILEDDCLPSKSFFSYCETLLDYYRDNKCVMHISGDQFVADFDNCYSYYFAKIQHVWGWASWADRWKQYKFDLKDYDEKNVEKFSENKNVQNYWRVILNKMKKHEIDTWDYQWAFKVVEMDGLCINPSKNLISNIGFGENSTHTSDKDNPLANMQVYEIETIIHPKVVSINQTAVDYIYKHHFNINFDSDFKENKNLFILKKIIHFNIKKIVMLNKYLIFIKKIYKKMFKKKNRCYDNIFEKYKNKRRFVEEKITLGMDTLKVPDVVSFAYQVREIFSNEIYKFKSEKQNPLIYDCGANIGTSILYFKQLFPGAKIKAFEADKKIFAVLNENIGHLKDVEIMHNAVWVNNDVLTFNSEGADGGSLIGDFKEKQKVKGIRLRNLLELDGEIDFLKMDIEGAESDVIKDCANSLSNVKNIFIEYHSFKNSEQNLDEILRILKMNGFRYFTETINKPANPFIHDDNDDPMDLQVNVFGVKGK